MKKVLLIVLIVLLFSALPFIAAAETVAGGSCGDNVSYTLDETGLLVISGSGDMTESPWRDGENAEVIKWVEIRNGVTGIGYFAFNNCSNVTSISIPDSVNHIEQWAFAGCSSLTDITLPDGIKAIENCTFYNCKSLTGISIPEGVSRIDYWAFAGCSSLTGITVPGSVTSIGERAFYGCNQLSGINIPDGVTSIGNNAFENCRSIISVTIPKSIVTIGEYTFDSFNGTVVFEGEAPEIDPTAFQDGHLFVVYPQGQPGWDSIVGNSYGAEWIHWMTNADQQKQPREAGPKDPTETLSQALSNNRSAHDYTRNWINPAKSFLAAEEDGSFTRVECIGDKVVIEEYSGDRELIWKKTLEKELPVWGGFYAGKDYNFIVYGQTNDEESNEKEVIRVVRYDRNWNRIDSASAYGQNTTEPFAHGSLAMDEGGDYLYLHTSRKRYTSADGKRHQVNQSLKLYIPEMLFTVADGSSQNYTSHSFSQVVFVDEGDVVMVDHGDAYPRAVTVGRMKNDTLMPGFADASRVTLLEISGETGDNYTGVTLGGAAASDTRYVVTGKSIDQEKFGNTSRDNVYVATASKENFTDAGATFRWQTTYPEENKVVLSNPYLIRVTGTQLLLIWAEKTGYGTNSSSVHYVVLDENGEEATEVYTTPGELSDVTPVISGGCATWYVTTGSDVVFYSLDLTDIVTPETVWLGEPGWQTDEEGNYLYGGEDGYAFTGQHTIDGEMYFFSDSGILLTGWIRDGVKWHYAADNGIMLHNSWVNDNGRWYHMDDDGTMQKGWVQIGDGWYCLNAEGILQTGWVNDNGCWYYMGSDGKMRTGWVMDGGTWYYLDESGVMADGWRNIGGTWYYFDGGAMAIGWKYLGGAWYYFADGAMASGWQNIGGAWYYFADGAMATGWQNLGGVWYYFADGAMATGWQLIDGRWEMFDVSGAWLYTWQGN